MNTTPHPGKQTISPDVNFENTSNTEEQVPLLHSVANSSLLPLTNPPSFIPPHNPIAAEKNVSPYDIRFFSLQKVQQVDSFSNHMTFSNAFPQPTNQPILGGDDPFYQENPLTGCSRLAPKF